MKHLKFRIFHSRLNSVLFAQALLDSLVQNLDTIAEAIHGLDTKASAEREFLEYYMNELFSDAELVVKYRNLLTRHVGKDSGAAATMAQGLTDRFADELHKLKQCATAPMPTDRVKKLEQRAAIKAVEDLAKKPSPSSADLEMLVSAHGLPDDPHPVAELWRRHGTADSVPSSHSHENFRL